mgnify:CR=1 FL=1
MSRDRAIIDNKDRKSYIFITTFSDGNMQVYYSTKEHCLEHMVCNTWILEQGLFIKYFQKLIFDLGEQLNKKVHRCYEIIDAFQELSVRESEVLFFMMQQQNSTKIADILYLSKRTIQHHIESIKYKMNCSSTPQLLQLASYLSYGNFIPRSLL